MEREMGKRKMEVVVDKRRGDGTGMVDPQAPAKKSRSAKYVGKCGGRAGGKVLEGRWFQIGGTAGAEDGMEECARKVPCDKGKILPWM
jgi:hypothetical protein